MGGEVCGLLCINDEEKSGVVIDNSCVFRIILNSVTEGQARGGGGGTHPDFGYPLQNGLPEQWLLARKRGAVTDPRPLRKGAVRGAFPVGAVVFSLASPRKAS